VLADSEVTDRVVNKCVGELGKALVAHVHAKSKDHINIECCKWAVWGQLTRDYSDELDEMSPPKSWGKKTNVKDDDKAAAPTHMMTALRKDGTVDVVAQVERLGFKADATVKPKKEFAKELGAGPYKIESITKKAVTLIDSCRPGLSHEVTKVVTHGELASMFYVWKETVIATMRVGDASKSDAWTAECAAARVKLALDMAYKANVARVDGRVHIVTKQGVVAKTDIDTGEMVLVPLTTKIGFALAINITRSGTDLPALDFEYEVGGRKYACVLRGTTARENDKPEDITLFPMWPQRKTARRPT
jgi:hypothetical protein